MILDPLKFTSDSIMWLKPVPTGDTSIVHVEPQCNITRLDFHSGSNSVSIPHPNPATDRVALDVSFMEDASPDLRLYNQSGENILTLMNGQTQYKSGSYHLEFDARTLPAGAYYIEFKAGTFHATRRLVVVK